MSHIEKEKGGWTRRRMLRAALAVPAIVACPALALAQGQRPLSKVSFEDISYGFRFVRKGDTVSYWVRAVPMKQKNENVPVMVVFGKAVLDASSTSAVDPQSLVYKRNIVLAKIKGYSQRGRFRTTTKKRNLVKGQDLYCQVLFQSGTRASDVWSFKV